MTATSKQLHIALDDMHDIMNRIRLIKDTAHLQRVTYDHLAEIEATLLGIYSVLHAAYRESGRRLHADAAHTPMTAADE